MKENNNNTSNKKNNKKPSFSYYWIYGVIVVLLLGYQFFKFSGSDEDWGWKDLRTAIEQNEIEKIEIRSKSSAEIYLTEAALELEKYKEFAKKESRKGEFRSPNIYMTVGDLETFERRIDELQSDISPEKRLFPRYIANDTFMDTLIGWSPMIFLILIWIFIMRRMSGGGAGGPGGQIFNIGKSKAQLFDENKKISTTFKDVAGLEGAKDEVQEIVNFLKSPEKYTKLGGKIPKGALLVGPPGTGKTLLAKAVAGEAGVPFFSLSGSDFVEMFVGVGASRVRDLFKKAKEKSPSIIFIDEIDAIGRARGKNQMTGGNDERENTLNQLLSEMDGFGTDHHVIVLAATNRAEILDTALTRAGRFDRQIYVDLPELSERKQIFEVHLKNIKGEPNLDVDFLAKQTPGFSGADIANLCNEAALYAARRNQEEVRKQDFLDAVDRIVGGIEKRSKIISPREKEVIAIHEAGHAAVGWLLEYGDPLVKVTIVPRGKSLGAAWYLPDERTITTKEQMLHQMCCTLGGRAAEQVIFNEISTGALSDLEKVTKQAQAMVSVYGLSEEIGNISFYDSSGQSSGFTKPYSEETARLIDNEISRIIEDSYQKTLELLRQNISGLKEIAKLLIDKEVIFKEDVENVLGERKWSKPKSVFIEAELSEESDTEVLNQEDTNPSTEIESMS